VISILGKFECSKEILTIAAMLQIHHVFVSPSNQKAAAVCSSISSSFIFLINAEFTDTIAAKKG